VAGDAPVVNSIGAFILKRGARWIAVGTAQGRWAAKVSVEKKFGDGQSDCLHALKQHCLQMDREPPTAGLALQVHSAADMIRDAYTGGIPTSTVGSAGQE